ncbi:hypothetical protein B0H15DRAFT_935119 [Mycena belliarum]|uniref:Uncharacterized protein n=1 Tax=Mycena belliarum TaxID=1033014 RepID=A0AAD6TQ64_9AGAR|nr:hypothetical protein B0H15DRAFT_935119 [Mycena belliae]
MISASRSDSHVFATRKRKAEDLDAGALFTAVLNRLRHHRHFAAIDQDDWEDAKSEILLDAELPEPHFSPRPFTDAQPFYEDLFAKDVGDINIAEDLALLSGVEDSDSSPADRYHEAAVALRENTLWKSVKNHVLMQNETSCRTAIDLVLLTAMELAQQQIAESSDVDDALCERHKLQRNCLDSDAREVRSWVVLLQELDIKDQELLPGMFLHGIFDYLLAVVPNTPKVRYTTKIASEFLKWSGMYAMSDLAQYIGQSSASVVEAKSGTTMCGKKAWAQVTAQGAALCVLTKRPSVINTLTDGVRWRFVRVSKNPDGFPSFPPSQLSDLPPTSSVPRRRKSDRLAGKLPALSTIAERKPFTAEATRDLDIFKVRDLAMILRLLELAILSSSEEFLKRAAGR